MSRTNGSRWNPCFAFRRSGSFAGRAEQVAKRHETRRRALARNEPVDRRERHGKRPGGQGLDRAARARNALRFPAHESCHAQRG